MKLEDASNLPGVPLDLDKDRPKGIENLSSRKRATQFTSAEVSGSTNTIAR